MQLPIYLPLDRKTLQEFVNRGKASIQAPTNEDGTAYLAISSETSAGCERDKPITIQHLRNGCEGAWPVITPVTQTSSELSHYWIAATCNIVSTARLSFPSEQLAKMIEVCVMVPNSLQATAFHNLFFIACRLVRMIVLII